MGRKKKYYLVIDTETANGLGQPLCYDVGYCICDRQGNIYERRSYIISDILLAESENFNNKQLIGTCYYASKIPQYMVDMLQGRREVITIEGLRNEIRYMIDLYEVTAVAAYNIPFDIRALNNTLRYATCSKYRYFFPYDTEMIDIWHMACQSILNSRNYYKQALKHKWYSEAMNCRTNAECCYRYLTKNYDFEEEHTGLEDVVIETYILSKCFKYSNIDKGIKYNCWQIPQEKWKQYIYEREELLLV